MFDGTSYFRGDSGRDNSLRVAVSASVSAELRQPQSRAAEQKILFPQGPSPRHLVFGCPPASEPTGGAWGALGHSGAKCSLRPGWGAKSLNEQSARRGGEDRGTDVQRAKSGSAKRAPRQSGSFKHSSGEKGSWAEVSGDSYPGVLLS